MPMVLPMAVIVSGRGCSHICKSCTLPQQVSARASHVLSASLVASPPAKPSWSPVAQPMYADAVACCYLPCSISLRSIQNDEQARARDVPRPAAAAVAVAASPPKRSWASPAPGPTRSPPRVVPSPSTSPAARFMDLCTRPAAAASEQARLRSRTLSAIQDEERVCCCPHIYYTTSHRTAI